MTKFAISFILGFRKHAYDEIYFIKKNNRKKFHDHSNLPKHVVVCGDLTHFIHIDYTFIPRKVTNSFDIVFYGNMAILYATSEPQAQRTFRKGRLHWCCFTLTHEVNLNDKEIIKLHDGNIVMKVYNSRYRVSEKLLRYQPGIYVHENVEDVKNMFAPIHKVNPQFSCEDSVQFCNSFVRIPLSEFGEEAGTLHKARAEFLVNYLVQHSNINAFITRPPFGFKTQSNSTTNAKDNPRASRERYSPAGTNETYLELIRSDFSFPGEMIFTDRKELLFDMNTTKNMRGFILVTVNNLLTSEQCACLNPFLISLTTLENVPTSILKDNGFDRIYIQYETPLFGSVQTNEYSVKSRINIQESRSFLTHKKNKLTLLNFAQSGFIIFKIRGIRRESKSEIKGALFGTQDVDFKLNEPFTKFTQNLYSDLLNNYDQHGQRTVEDRLLFVGKYTYGNSLNFGWIATSSITCTTMRNLITSTNNNIESIRKREYLNTVDIHFSNEKMFTEDEQCFLNAELLLNSQTILNLTMSIASSLSKTLLTILTTPEPLSRIGLLIYNVNVILDLLTMIFEYNESIRTDGNVDCAKQRLVRNVPLKTDKFYKQFLTGFYIDNRKTFYLFIEGSATGYIHIVWNKIMHLPRKEALVWYNSDLVFTERLYSGMLPCTTIYGIVLKEPIEKLFQRSYAFLKGSMPIPCWLAMRKLNFLFMESTMIFTSSSGLFPTLEELISFDIEFGIPKKMFDPIPNSSTTVLFD